MHRMNNTFMHHRHDYNYRFCPLLLPALGPPTSRLAIDACMSLSLRMYPWYSLLLHHLNALISVSVARPRAAAVAASILKLRPEMWWLVIPALLNAFLTSSTKFALVSALPCLTALGPPSSAPSMPALPSLDTGLCQSIPRLLWLLSSVCPSWTP